MVTRRAKWRARWRCRSSPRELAGITELNGDSVAAKVADAVKKANSKIYERTITEVDKQGMGTTASVLILTGSRYLIGQVGDSRVYLLRDGKLRQLTKDHSYVQEQVDAGFLTPEQARYHPVLQRDHALCRRQRHRRAGHVPR